MHLLLLQHVNQLHLLLDAQKQVIYLLLLPLTTLRPLLHPSSPFLHRPHLQLVQGLGHTIDLELSFRELLQDFVLFSIGRGD